MFDISIEQRVLMKALEYLESTVGKNSTGLGDNCIAMTTTGNGSVEMYTTNTTEFTKLEAIVAVGGNTQDTAPYVDFKRFKAIISSIPSNEVVSLKASVNDLLINFALKKTPIKLVGCNNGMIPLPSNQFPSATMVTVPKRFVEQATNNACSIITDSASTPIYNCIRIFTSNMNVEVTALDMTNKRTFVQEGTATNNNPQQDILLEASKFKKSLKIFEDFNELEFYMDQNMVRVDGTDIISSYYQKTQGMISNISYFARRLTGAFPSNIKSSFSVMPTEFCELSKDEILNCFTRIKAIEDQTSNGTIGFEIANNNAIITLNSSYGNIEDSIQTENTVSQSFKTVFKHESINDIMKVIETDVFELGVLPNHPTNYVIKSRGSSNVMFTIPGMVGASATP
jgi:DNA polymerase III sliding clamp (beta) subunit (PCNA family)